MVTPWIHCGVCPFHQGCLASNRLTYCHSTSNVTLKNRGQVCPYLAITNTTKRIYMLQNVFRWERILFQDHIQMIVKSSYGVHLKWNKWKQSKLATIAKYRPFVQIPLWKNQTIMPIQSITWFRFFSLMLSTYTYKYFNPSWAFVEWKVSLPNITIHIVGTLDPDCLPN